MGFLNPISECCGEPRRDKRISRTIGLQNSVHTRLVTAEHDRGRSYLSLMATIDAVSESNAICQISSACMP